MIRSSSKVPQPLHLPAARARTTAQPLANALNSMHVHAFAPGDSALIEYGADRVLKSTQLRCLHALSGRSQLHIIACSHTRAVRSI